MKEIVFAGYGGQGVLTSGLVISEIAVQKGYNATWIPSYGSAMRGGTANCTVKFGEDIIYNPSQEEPDILLAMNAPSYRMFERIVAEGGSIVVNADFVSEGLSTRSDINIIKVYANTLAKELDHPYGANIIVTGIITKLSGEFSEDEAIHAMNSMFRKKGKEKFEVKNTEAFKLGFNLV